MLTSLLTALQAVAPLPLADHAPLLAAWDCRTVAEGELLSQAGTVCQELFFIQQGVLRLLGPPGKAVTHSFRQAGQFCTVLTSFEQQVPTSLCIQAACPAQVLAIHQTHLAALGHRLPYLPGVLAQVSRQALLEKLDTQRAYAGQDAAGRYRTFLQRQPDIARCVPQHMIASYLGITPQSLSRLRKALG